MTTDHVLRQVTRHVDIDAESFRHVIGNFASGVTVVTARHDGKNFGLTANAVTSVSLDPPLLAICLNQRTGTHHAIKESGIFAVNILHENQADVAHRFATPCDKFEGVSVTDGRLGAPLLEEALAHLECRVTEDTRGGNTHSIFVGRVVHASAREGAPLAYFRGSFGRFLSQAYQQAYDEVRERVLDRRLAPGVRIDADRLAEDLGVERSWIHDSLARLAAEGVVARRPPSEWVVVPIHASISDAVNTAKCAIELGVADTTVGRVSDDQLEGLRVAMERTVPFVQHDRFVDVVRWNETNNDFHECLVGLARCEPLLDAYRRLSLPGIIARTLALSDQADDLLIDDHRRIVAAYEAADLEAARVAIRVHTDRAMLTLRRAIESAGGVI